jgi:RNA polymerase sigma-70 factor (ECF subfamily)
MDRAIQLIQESTTQIQETKPDIPSLTQAMAQGGDDAFREFFRLYFQRLLCYLLVVARGDEETAREALQLALVRVARHVKRFDSEPAFWAWLTVVARNALVDEQRKSWRYLTFLTRWFHREGQTEASPSTGDNQLSECLNTVIDSLSAEDRGLVEKKYFDGQSVRDIAQSLDISEKAVESRLTRIRARLKQLILQRLKT